MRRTSGPSSSPRQAGSWRFPKSVACITATSARRRSLAPAVLTTIAHASQVLLSRPARPLPVLHRDSDVTVQGRRSNDAGRPTLPPTRLGVLDLLDRLTHLGAPECASRLRFWRGTGRGDVVSASDGNSPALLLSSRACRCHPSSGIMDSPTLASLKFHDQIPRFTRFSSPPSDLKSKEHAGRRERALHGAIGAISAALTEPL